MKVNIKRMVRVRATDAENACTGCAFGEALNCQMPLKMNNVKRRYERQRSCINEKDLCEDFIFIKPGKRAMAEYLALVMEHGLQKDFKP